MNQNLSWNASIHHREEESYMKKIVSLSFVVLLVLSLTATGHSQSATGVGDGKAVSIKLGHNSHVESFTGKALANWAKQISDQTGGKLKIDIYPQNQLGNNKELSEQTALGSLDMNVQGMSAMVDYKVEQGYLAKVPFLFRSTEHARRWWTSPEGMAIVKKVETQRVRALSIGLNRMPRQFASKSKAIKVPEDIRNLKVRAGDTATNSTLRILGAVPTSVALNEMYTAVSQGVVDVIELPLDYILDYSIFEVTKYLTMVNHTFDLQWLVVNAKKFDSLPQAYQKLLLDSIPNLEKDNNAREEANFKDTLQKLKDKGMTVVNTDRSLWEAIVPKVAPDLEKTWPSTKGLYEKIMNMR
jgi:tripartite ATP-independent transporter DctP family solute receptor